MIQLAKYLKKDNQDWIRPINHPEDHWVIYINKLKEKFGLSNIDWIEGNKSIVCPKHSIKIEEDTFFRRLRTGTSITFELPPEDGGLLMSDIQFPELKPFIEKFKKDYPNPYKCAFIMMKFKDTPMHKQITESIRDICAKYDIKALRADDKRYSDSLLSNIRTYMHGCSFGIAIFDRVMENEFNPNVSLEVGYMMGLNKPVCLLKDSTLTQLHTDIVGQLYEPFNVHDINNTIQVVLEKWLIEKELIVE